MCQKCGADSGSRNVIVLLPVVRADQSPSKPLLPADAVIGVCESCAEKSKAYCKKHDKVHVSFPDRTSVCLDCAMDLVEEEKTSALRYYALYCQNILSENEREPFKGRVAIDARIRMCEPEIAFLRFLAIKALRDGLMVHQYINVQKGWQALGAVLG